MVLHSALTGTDLHFPLGHATAGALSLSDNTANAYLIEEVSGADYIAIDTTNSAEAIKLGNATTNPYLQLLGTGEFRVGSTIRFKVSSAGTGVGPHSGAIGYDLHVLASDTSTAPMVAIVQSSTGDAAQLWSADSTNYTVGIDNSSSNEWVVTESTALGDSSGDANRFAITPSNGSFGFSSVSATGGWTRRAQVVTRELAGSSSAGTIWSLTLAEGQAVIVHATVCGLTTTEAAWYQVTGGARRYTGGAAVEIGSEVVHAGEEDATWDVTLDTSGNDVRLRGVMGAADTGKFVATVWYQLCTA